MVAPDWYYEAIRGPHRRLSRAQVVYKGDIIDDTFYQGDLFRLSADESSVSYERLADTRTSADMTFHIRSTRALDILEPVSASEVIPFCGIEYRGEIYWEQLGVLRVSDIDETRSGGVWKVRVSCLDRSEVIRQYRLTDALSFTPGSVSYPTRVKSLIDIAAKGFTPIGVLPPASLLTTKPGMIYDTDDDLWSAATEAAQADSCELFWDRMGLYRMQPIPDPRTVRPSMTISPNDNVEISPMRRRSSLRDIYNGVICRGSAPWLLFPVVGEVWDEDPLSPTWRYGSFGERPKKIEDSLATTTAQAQAIAQAEFNRVRGILEEVDFGLIKDFTQQVGNVIEVLKTENVNAYYLLNSLRIPLGAASMTGTLRRQL